jgi:hypothetical protein
MPRTQAASSQFVDLMATMLTADAPFAEVLAIVHQEVIAIFTKPQAGATDHFLRIERARSLKTDPNSAPLCELGLGNLFDWTSTQAARPAAILHDASVAYIYAMVRIPTTWGDKVRTDSWGSLRIKGIVRITQLARITGPPEMLARE